MNRPAVCVCLALILAASLWSQAAFGKAYDGVYIENAHTLERGVWNLRSSLEFGSKAKPVTVSAAVTGSSSVALKVGSILLPVEIRYGLSDVLEIGGDLGFEMDRGGIEVSGGGAFLNGSGLRRIRMLGKWNFFQDMSGLVDLAFAGDETLYNSTGSFDIGLTFLYGPQIGPGTLNTQLGLLMKGGDVKVGTTLAADFGTVFSYGVGYLYPSSDRLSWVFELAGSSSPYDGKTGITGTKGRLGLMFGGKYMMSDRFTLDGDLGFGIQKGSPTFTLRAGGDWVWGAISEKAESPTRRWTPTSGGQASGDKKSVATGGVSETKEPAKSPEPAKPSYERPTRYDVPRPPEPPPSGPTVEEQLRVRMKEATDAFTRKDYAAAASAYEAAIKLKDNDALLHYNLATTYFEQKRYADAKVYYKNALTLNAADVDSRLYLGYTYYYLQDQPSAIREWQKVLEIDPSHALARENLKSLGIE